MPTHIAQIILASESPRRRQLLAAAGYDFVVRPPRDTAECGTCSRETAAELVARLAFQKAQDVALSLDCGLVLGCDTVAECRGRILGKPRDRADAKKMLQWMRGRDHQVHSGVCLIDAGTMTRSVQVDVTCLKMHDLSDETIQVYLDTNEWEGKAGAFGYQDGLDWVEITSGSESNVVGLPLELLESMLER